MSNITIEEVIHGKRSSTIKRKLELNSSKGNRPFLQCCMQKGKRAYVRFFGKSFKLLIQASKSFKHCFGSGMNLFGKVTLLGVMVLPMYFSYYL